MFSEKSSVLVLTLPMFYQRSRRGAAARLPATHGTPIDIQSHHRSTPRTIPNYSRPEFVDDDIEVSPMSNRASQIRNSAPISTPLANAGHPIPVPALNGPNLGQEIIECVLYSTLCDLSLMGITVCLTGSH